MKIRIVSLLSVLAAAVMPLHAQQCMTWDEAYRRADSLAARLTLDEKISMMRGYDKFFLPGVPDKGMPYIFTSDATQGLRLNLNLPDPTMIRQIDRSTAFPSPIMLAATFSPEMAYEYARAVGEECRASGVEVLLGPGMNIYRNSQCSRNFEYLGEDPYLAARMVERYVEGMQSTGTLACLKHFLANNTEWYRRRSNSIVDERAIHEIYTPAFVAGIEAGAATVMTAYNRLNGEWCGQSEYVINDLLRGEFGFRGLVMSDWRSIYDWGKVVASGLNVDMPGEDYFYLDGDIRGRVERGEFSESDIDRMIRPTIATAIAFGLYDRILSGDKYRPELLDSLPSHARTAYEVAAEGTVLLRNDGILPLDASGRSILLTGRWLDGLPRGGGAARVEGYDTVTPVDALKALGDVTVSKNPTDEELRNADIVIFTTGTYDTEAVERPFALPKADERAVRRAVELNPNTIVIVNSGSGIDMTAWSDRCAALIYGWYPGQNGYEAIADIIRGKISPSGKLPMTIERSFSDSPAAGSMPRGASFYDKVRNEHFIMPYDILYDESVLVGYRWYEYNGIRPLFPFGYGLSYTTFKIDRPCCSRSTATVSKGSPARISVRLRNTGERRGKEVIQLYVGENTPSIVRPPKELKRIHKVELDAGESATVEFEIGSDDLAFWDVQTHAWKTNAGEYTLYIGTSSEDIACTIPLKVIE